MDENFEIRKQTDPVLKDVIIDFIQDCRHENAFVHWLIDFGQERIGVRTALLAGVALDIDLICRESFRFFLLFWALCLFKDPLLAER